MPRKKRRANGTFVEEESEEDEGDVPLPVQTARPAKAPAKTEKRAKRPAAAAAATAAAASAAEAGMSVVAEDDHDAEDTGYDGEGGVPLNTMQATVEKFHDESPDGIHWFPESKSVSPDRAIYLNRNVSGCLMHNVVAKATLNHTFPSIYELAMRAFGVRIKRQLSVCIHMRYPRVTARVFRTGTVNIVGAKSSEIARLAIYQLSDYIARQMGVAVKPSNITINNMMATMYLNYRVDLKRLVATTSPPGGGEVQLVFGAALIYVAGGVTLLFRSGKMIIFGPRNPSELIRIRAQLIPHLAQYHDGEVDLQQMERERVAAIDVARREQQRRQHANKVRQMREKIETGHRRLYNCYSTDAAFAQLIDVAVIHMEECLPLVGGRKRFVSAAKEKIKLPPPTVAAVNSPHADVCRHRVSLRFNGAKTDRLFEIGVVGSRHLIQLHAQNGFLVPEHFSVPPPPVQKRKEPVKNPTRAPGEYHRVEGKVLRFGLAVNGVEQERPRPPAAAAATPAAAGRGKAKAKAKSKGKGSGGSKRKAEPTLSDAEQRKRARV